SADRGAWVAIADGWRDGIGTVPRGEGAQEKIVILDLGQPPDDGHDEPDVRRRRWRAVVRREIEPERDDDELLRAPDAVAAVDLVAQQRAENDDGVGEARQHALDGEEQRRRQPSVVAMKDVAV